MLRLNRLAPALVFVMASAAAAQVNVTGEWALDLTTPNGHRDYVLYLNQEGPRVTGHVTSEYGEAAIRVTLNGDAITVTWSQAEEGKMLEISLTGTVKGDSISGTAKLGTIGQGPFQADRTSSF